MTRPVDIPFQQLLDALLDVDTPFHPRFLYRLSDLDQSDLARLKETWPEVPIWRRQALMEDVAALNEKDYLLSFEGLGRLAVHDSDPKVRLIAVRTLCEYEHKDLIPLFLELVEKDSDAEVRAGAASALGCFVYAGEVEKLPSHTLREIEDRLIRVAGSADAPLIRRSALESLGYSSRDDVAGLIETAFASGNRDWMASALLAMGRSANERWEPEVLSMLESNLPALRSEAARAAGELEISAAVPHLLELLDDPDDRVRTASIWSLSQIGGSGVSDALERLYQETDDEKEANLIEDALDNLAFTEGMEPFRLLDIPEKPVEETLEELGTLEELQELDELGDLDDLEELEEYEDLKDLEDEIFDLLDDEDTVD